MDAALKLVPDLRKQYKFEAAKKTLEQAAVLAKGTAPDRLAEVEQALQDLKFVERLDDIRYRKWLWMTEGDGKGHFNEEIASPAYRQAPADRDLNLTTLDHGLVSARRDRGIRGEGRIGRRGGRLGPVRTGAGLARSVAGSRTSSRPRFVDEIAFATRPCGSDRDAVKKLATDADSTSTSVATLGVLATLMKPATGWTRHRG